MIKKYELLERDKETGLCRIKALKEFGCVKESEIGGFVKSEDNLSQYGDCWIFNDAIVKDNAMVCEDAEVYDKAIVCGRAIVRGQSIVADESIIGEYAILKDEATVSDKSIIKGNVILSGETRVCKFATLTGEVEICNLTILADKGNDNLKMIGQGTDKVKLIKKED